MHNSKIEIKNTHQHITNLTHNKWQGITLTHQAANQIQKLIIQNNNTLGLRVFIKKIGCAGFSYAFEKVTTQNFNPTDLVFSHNNKTKLFVSLQTLPLIDGSELDYVKKDLRYSFQFKNPQANHSCGCGSSFNLAD